MPWCPQCGEEYREAFRQCSDCGVWLVRELPEGWKEGTHLWKPEPICPLLPVLNKNLPQTICVSCGEQFDFDYPKCPYCNHPAMDITERIVPREEDGKPRRWRIKK